MRIGGSAIILVPRSGIDARLAGVRRRILLCLFPIGPDPREANPATDENADTVSKHDPIANAITATFEEIQGIARPPLRIRISESESVLFLRGSRRGLLTTSSLRSICF